MSSNDIKVVGLCRFSYPAIGGFQRTHETPAEREAYLYAPDQMEARFRHFECLTLPSIKHQLDPEFTFLVMIGESLPKPYLERLYDITKDVPQIQITPYPSLRHRIATQNVIRAALEGQDGPSLQFRLDDDDAVAVDFVALSKKRILQNQRLHRNRKPFMVEFSRGYHVHLGKNGILGQAVCGSFLSCGMAVLFPAGARKTIMYQAHDKLRHDMLSLIDPMPHMYIRAVHDKNDSRVRGRTKGFLPLTETIRNDFADRFHVHEDRVKRAFAAPYVFPDRA